MLQINLSLFAIINNHINKSIIDNLSKLGFKIPTEIQTKVVPLALENKDIIGQSKTGSGKTMAYLLPLINEIDTARRELQTIILATIHEIVMRVITISLVNSEIKYKY